MRIGYTLMGEQSPPQHLVRLARPAEDAGFDFFVLSDHYFPWLDEQGHSPNTWVVLGAVATQTSRVDLMTYVTCPIMRYHPTVVAQQAATVQLLSDGRFHLGLGAGENLNEHVIGEGWPAVSTRHAMFDDALEIINQLFLGGYVTYQGEYLACEGAKLWDLPEQRVPIGLAVSGRLGNERLAAKGDFFISTEPDADLVQGWERAREKAGVPTGTRKVGQLPVSWYADTSEATRIAHEQFRWFAGGWKVNADLPGTAGFDSASQFVTPEDVAGQIPCGADPDAVTAACQAFADAGYTDLALVQIGDAGQEQFLRDAETTLLPALRKAFG